MRLLLALLLLPACVTPAAPAPRDRIAALKEVESEAVANCKFVGRFEGNSAQAGEPGLAQAREEARAKAVQAGASHIVVGREWQTPDVAAAVLKAYDCTQGR